MTSLEFSVLTLLSGAKGPLGSGALWSALYGTKESVSEPTLGRLLRKMDTLGLTRKLGKQGRVLTPTGIAALEERRNQQTRAGVEGEFLRAIRIETLDDVMDLLVARRAIEREIARLAALNATPGDVEAIRSALEAQQFHVDRGEYALEEDLRVHQSVAKAAGNRVLSAALDLMRHDPRLSEVIIAVRQFSGSRLGIEHGRLLQAIEDHDPQGAEEAMLTHLDIMMREVEAYRLRFSQPVSLSMIEGEGQAYGS